MKQTSRISLSVVPLWCLWWCMWYALGCQALVNRARSSWNGYEFHMYPHPAKKTVVPRDIMVDVTNRLGLDLLAIHNEYNENNIAISPYGALSVLIALGEGLQGDAVQEIQHAAHIPNDISIIRVGLRDIHRHLKSYFIPREGFLAGLTLNHENVTLRPEYEEILMFYGYDTPTFNNVLYPEPLPTEKPLLANIPGTTSQNRPSITPLSITTAVPSSSEDKTTTTTTEGITTVSGDARELDKVTETSTQSATTTTPESIIELQPEFMIATTTKEPATITLEPLVTTIRAATTSRAPETTTVLPASMTIPQEELTSRLASPSLEPVTTIESATTSLEPTTIKSEPVTTATESVSITLEPVATDTSPNKPEPAESTLESVTTIVTPVTSTQQSNTTTLNLADSTSMVAEQSNTTGVSVTITSEPQTLTLEPLTTFSEPVTTTSEPLTTTLETLTRTLEPLTTTLEQLTTTLEPLTNTSKPVITTKTAVTTQELPSDIPVPETTTLPPVIPTLEQVIMTLEPVITTLEPAKMEHAQVTTTLEPIITTLEPIIITTEPVSTTLEPVVITIEPVSTTFEPALTKIESVVMTLEPVITTLESLITTLEPIITTLEPGITKIEPVITTAQSVVTTLGLVTTNAIATTIQELVNTHPEGETSTFESTTTNVAVVEPKTVVLVEDGSEPTSTAAVTTNNSGDSDVLANSTTTAATLVTNEPTETIQEITIDNEILTSDVDNSGLGFAGSSKRRARSQFNVIELNRWRGRHSVSPKRKIRSVTDYVMARYYDGHHSPLHFQRPFVGEEQPSFLVHGKYREHRINFMKYDTVLPFVYVIDLDAVALSFPLDSSRYYLLLLLPRDETGVDKLICDLRQIGSLRPIVDNLRYGHVVATIPSFTLKGYVTLTPSFQKLGIKRVFEPRQSDFSPMTDQQGIFVKNIEQAITVNIKNYVDPNNLATNKYPVEDVSSESNKNSSSTNRPAVNSSVKTLGLNGLKNIGYTCSMNSVIQCLSNTKWLLEYLKKDAYTRNINTSISNMKEALIETFSEVIKELWTEDSLYRVVDIVSLKSQIQCFASRFINYTQQDAQEFLRYLLEKLHEDVNRVTDKPKLILTEIVESENTKELWSIYLRMDNSKLVDNFVRQLNSTLKCTFCGHRSVTFDTFWRISLPILQRTGQLSISQCLDSFTKEETMDVMRNRHVRFAKKEEKAQNLY